VLVLLLLKFTLEGASGRGQNVWPGREFWLG
jgi:hypothetical protein